MRIYLDGFLAETGTADYQKPGRESGSMCWHVTRQSTLEYDCRFKWQRRDEICQDTYTAQAIKAAEDKINDDKAR